MPIQSAFTLNPNEIFGSLANMIISQEVFADNLGKHQTLVDKARVDGSLYGDKKLYYSTDALKTMAWGEDAEAANLLALHRPQDPKVQAITLNVFRQIALTVDQYLSKRAWSTEGAFASFNSVMLGWIRETKKIYDGTTYNVFLGTTVATGAGQSRTITLDGTKDGQLIAEGLANLLVEMSDYSRAFNDYGFIRSYSPDAIKVIWNSKYVNKIKKVDTPTIYHQAGLVDKLDEEVLPARYFGRAVVVATDCGSGKVIGTSGEIDATKGTVRSKVEKEFIFEDDTIHVFPGDALASGVKVSYTGGSVSDPDFNQSEVYIEDADVICKVVVKLPPYMSAFEVGTSFFNARSLTENHYLTFGHNTLEYLKNYPFVTVKKA